MHGSCGSRQPRVEYRRRQQKTCGNRKPPTAKRGGFGHRRARQGKPTGRRIWGGSRLRQESKTEKRARPRAAAVGRGRGNRLLEGIAVRAGGVRHLCELRVRSVTRHSFKTNTWVRPWAGRARSGQAAPRRWRRWPESRTRQCSRRPPAHTGSYSDRPSSRTPWPAPCGRYSQTAR